MPTKINRLTSAFKPIVQDGRGTSFFLGRDNDSRTIQIRIRRDQGDGFYSVLLSGSDADRLLAAAGVEMRIERDIYNT